MRVRLNIWKDDKALATFGNLCMPMVWMTWGSVLETINGFLFGTYGKLCLLCFPS